MADDENSESNFSQWAAGIVIVIYAFVALPECWNERTVIVEKRVFFPDVTRTESYFNFGAFLGLAFFGFFLEV